MILLRPNPFLASGTGINALVLGESVENGSGKKVDKSDESLCIEVEKRMCHTPFFTVAREFESILLSKKAQESGKNEIFAQS